MCSLAFVYFKDGLFYGKVLLLLVGMPMLMTQFKCSI